MPNLCDAPGINNQASPLYVVGDKFINFCEKENLVTYSRLITSIKEKTLSAKKLIIGQGISQSKLDCIRSLLLEISPQQIPTIEEKISLKVKPEFVHKHFEHNVLITYPEQIDEYEYMASLAIDENCADMQDHITGKHIPGTLLIEAGRQIFMASFEAMCLQIYNREGESQPLKNTYILQNFEAEYHSFLFPLEVEAKLKIVDIDWDKEKHSGTGTCHITFTQNGNLAAEIKCRGSVFSKAVVSILEKRQFMQFYKKINNITDLATKMETTESDRQPTIPIAEAR